MRFHDVTCIRNIRQTDTTFAFFLLRNKRIKVRSKTTSLVFSINRVNYLTVIWKKWIKQYKPHQIVVHLKSQEWPSFTKIVFTPICSFMYGKLNYQAFPRLTQFSEMLHIIKGSPVVCWIIGRANRLDALWQTDTDSFCTCSLLLSSVLKEWKNKPKIRRENGQFNGWFFN